MAAPLYQISGDARRALEEFSTAFDSALASPADFDLWAQQFGMVISSKTIKTTFPIPISAAGYNERKGDDKMRSLYARSLSVTPVEWADGVAELARIIEAPDFIGWGSEPARIAVEAKRQPNRLIASILEANPNLGFYRDENLGTDLAIPLFSGSHPVSIFDSSLGTFDNDHAASAIDADMFRAALTRFRKKLAANGKPMGLRLSHMIVPPALEQEAKDFLESDLLRAAFLEGGDGAQKNTQLTTNNRFKNLVQLTVADELTAEDKIYLVASNGPKPWIIQDGGTPEQITYDKSDPLYKNEGKVGVKYVLTMGAKAALPHAIERITIS
jgi:hypothetical protein